MKFTNFRSVFTCAAILLLATSCQTTDTSSLYPVDFDPEFAGTVTPLADGAEISLQYAAPAFHQFGIEIKTYNNNIGKPAQVSRTFTGSLELASSDSSKELLKATISLNNYKRSRFGNLDKHLEFDTSAELFMSRDRVINKRYVNPVQNLKARLGDSKFHVFKDPKEVTAYFPQFAKNAKTGDSLAKIGYLPVFTIPNFENDIDCILAGYVEVQSGKGLLCRFSGILRYRDSSRIQANGHMIFDANNGLLVQLKHFIKPLSGPVMKLNLPDLPQSYQLTVN